jgi:hypothetical protein
MITQAELQERFEYRNGTLFRKKAVHKYPAGSAVGSIVTGGVARPDKKYLQTKIQGKCYAVHRLIFMYHNGYCPDQLDHINRDSLDNRIENLRPATSSQNMMNRKLFSNSKSGYSGVSWHKASGKWFVYVDSNKRRRNIGYFEDLELAALVASEARDKYHGSFAVA